MGSALVQFAWTVCLMSCLICISLAKIREQFVFLSICTHSGWVSARIVVFICTTSRFALIVAHGRSSHYQFFKLDIVHKFALRWWTWQDVRFAEVHIEPVRIAEVHIEPVCIAEVHIQPFRIAEVHIQPLALRQGEYCKSFISNSSQFDTIRFITQDISS